MRTDNLKPLLWIAGAIALAFAIAWILTRSADSAPDDPRPVTASVDGTLRLLQVERVVAGADVGADFLFTATALRDGAERGTLRGVCTRLGARMSQCNVTAALKKGSIVVADLIYQNPKGSGTITGGTGRYQDASGFVTSQRLKDGDVQLTFRFN